jgi:hypothetical protein
MKRYKKLFESQTYHSIAYRDIENTRYKSIKPYREYLIITSESKIEKDGNMICYDNIKLYTKENYASKKISNKMILVDVKNMCIDIKRDHWIFKNEDINI